METVSATFPDKQNCVINVFNLPVDVSTEVCLMLAAAGAGQRLARVRDHRRV